MSSIRHGQSSEADSQQSTVILIDESPLKRSDNLRKNLWCHVILDKYLSNDMLGFQMNFSILDNRTYIRCL